ncbi:MAG: 1-acylglycerol-3-phosphate O-acyltransferase [Butyricicoccus sp.]|nr:1-acylglycerol-3-phosphate O-acyltransferase [Butyricicoccus sp.]
MRTLIWFTYFWLYLLLCIPVSLYIRHLAETDGPKADRYVAHFVRNWARRLLKLAGAKVTVTGQENLPQSGAYMVVANHQGYFDIPIMLSCVGEPRGLVAKQEIDRIPGIRTWMRYLHCLFVDRSSPRAGAQTIVDGAKLLESGHSLTIFPEGTRSKGGPMREFKAGAFRIASRAGVPVVPVTIDGSFRLMEGNKMLIRPAEVKVTIHPAIATADMGREELRALPHTVKDTIEAKLAY